MTSLVFHPAKDKPKTALFLTFALGIALQTLYQLLSPSVAVALWVALVVSLRDFFCPTTYCFDNNGLSVSGPLKFAKSYPWRRFRAYVEDRNGLFLTPYFQKRGAEGARGVFLPLLPQQKAVVRECCREFGLVKRGKNS